MAEAVSLMGKVADRRRRGLAPRDRDASDRKDAVETPAEARRMEWERVNRCRRWMKAEHPAMYAEWFALRENTTADTVAFRRAFDEWRRLGEPDAPAEPHTPSDSQEPSGARDDG